MIDSYCARPAARKQSLTLALHGIGEDQDDTKSVFVAGPSDARIWRCARLLCPPLLQMQTIAIARSALCNKGRSQPQPKSPTH